MGHDRQKKYFARVLARDAFVHAYLLTGPAQIGKRSVAMDVVRMAHERTEPGINDPYAVLVGSREHTSISIEDDIRPLRKALSLRPPQGVRTFVLVDKAERMTPPAANALLKILEEPPSYVSFLLISGSPGLLPETIRSRCHEIRFTPPHDDTVREFLSSLHVATKDYEMLVRLSGGSIGWLKEVLEAGDITKTVASVGKLDGCLTEGIAERLVWAKKLADRDDIREQVLRWLNVTRADLSEKPDRVMRAHGLLKLYETLGHSNYSARMAIEHFLIQT